MTGAKDIINWLAQRIDRDRYSTFAVLITAVISLYAIGCQQAVASPFSGKKVKEAQLMAEAEAHAAKLKADLAKIKAEYGKSVAALEAAYKTGLAAAQADADAALADIQANGEAMAAATQAALDEIERKQLAIEKTLGIITATTSAFAPGYGELIVALTSILGTSVGIGSAARVLDTKRKDQVIAALKKPAAESTPSTA